MTRKALPCTCNEFVPWCYTAVLMAFWCTLLATWC